MRIGDGHGVWTCGGCELTVAAEDPRLRKMIRETHRCGAPKLPRKRRTSRSGQA